MTKELIDGIPQLDMSDELSWKKNREWYLSPMNGWTYKGEMKWKNLCTTEPVSSEVLPRHPISVLLNEIDCRIEHGAESNGHLNYVHKELKKILS